MRKLIVHEFITLDGVIQAPGGADALKAQPGKNILTDGSGQLLPTLLAHDLVDELHLSLYPLSVGGGKRLFPDSALSRFTLVAAKPYPTGVGLHYARALG